MPKMKTNKSAAKRFKITARGKVKRSHSYVSHIRTSKTRKRKRNLRRATTVSSAEQHKVKRMLGR